MLVDPLGEILSPFRASNKSVLFSIPAGDENGAKWFPTSSKEGTKATYDLVERRGSAAWIGCT